MLRTRVITACGLLALIVSSLTVWPRWTFHLLVMTAVFFAHRELYRMLMTRRRAYRLTASAFGLLIAALQIWGDGRVPIDLALVLSLFLIAVLFLQYATTLERYPQHVAIAAFGVLYISCTLPYLSRIAMLPHGGTLVGMVLMMVALSDTAAYSVGNTWGRRKLAPLTSPNKTWEGFYGGFLGSLAGLLIMRAIAYPAMPLLPSLGLALVIGFVAPCGDLIESALKRAVHVKDSSRMLPGHGGMLDRCDAYLFSAPIMYYFAKWILGL